MSMPVGNLAITLGVTTPADWLARADADPHFLTTLDFLLAHGRYIEAIACLTDHVERTAYARWIVDHPEGSNHAARQDPADAQHP